MNDGNRAAPLPDNSADAIKADLRSFFGPRGETYLQFYERRQARGRGPLLSWSWPAFGCWFAWFWYRKLWAWGLIAFTLPAVADRLVPGLGGLLGLVAVAALAKECYLQGALAALQVADRMGLAGRARQDFLRKRGGVSLPAGTIGAVLVLAVGAMSALLQLPPLIAQMEAAGLLAPR